MRGCLTHCEYVLDAFMTSRIQLISSLCFVYLSVLCFGRCFCVLNAHGAALVENGKKLNQAQVDAEGKKVRSLFDDNIPLLMFRHDALQLPSAWALSLQVICTATVYCENTTTATETNMIADLRKNWSQMMQRVSRRISHVF